MLNDSPYTKLKQSQDSLLNTGCDYRDVILEKTMSKQMFRSNTVMTTFLQYMNSVVYELVESVKKIKTFANPALDKNERRII